MLSVITQSPQSEPVSVTEVRTDLRLDDSEDLLLASLITSARMIVEANTGSRLITQKWDVMFDHWPTDAQKTPEITTLACPTSGRGLFARRQ